ncbi:MAG TPA: hypothetical protein VF549_07380 [Solirubrobacteraceae bacterium]
MNPDRQSQKLVVERAEWIPSSPDDIEVRVYGLWNGSTVPPPVTLLIGDTPFASLSDPPPAGLAPAWSAAFLVPGELRAALENAEAVVAGPDFVALLPAAQPGAMDPPPGTVVDPAVLAERRARRAELAEESAAQRAASAEQTVETLRTQLDLLEERAARAGAERDTLAARVADAERMLKRAEQREEAERRRRAELEEEVASAERRVESDLEDLRARLAGAEELARALERELDHARRRTEDATRIAEAERSARRAAEETAKRANAEAEELRARLESGVTAPDEALEAELEALRAEADGLRAEADSLRARAADADALRAEADALRARAADAEAFRAEADSLRARAADADALRAEADALRARAADAEAFRAEADALRARASLADELRIEAEALRAEADALRVEADSLRARAREADRLRAETEVLRRRAAAADELRARTTELERRLVAEPRRGETDALRARAADLERRLAAERAAREEAEALRTESGQSERERALVAQVAALEAELARRVAVHGRVQEAIALIRTELSQVREQVEDADPARASATAAVANLRTELLELEERAQALDGALRARTAELDAARGELDRARDDAAAARAEADAERQALASAEHSAAEARRIAADLRDRLAAEQAARTLAEQRLAERGDVPPADPTLDPAPTGDPALDTLISGLRAQVAAAREQLARWGGEAPPEEPGAATKHDLGADPAAGDLPSLDEPLPPKPRAEQPAAAPSEPRAQEPGGARSEARAQQPAVAPSEPRVEPPPAAPPPAAPSAPARMDPLEDETRRRLQAIAAELRAAVPERASSAGGPDVIGDLQRAAERLRAAAEQELRRLEADPSAPPPASPAQSTASPAPGAAAPPAGEEPPPFAPGAAAARAGDEPSPHAPGAAAPPAGDAPSRPAADQPSPRDIVAPQPTGEGFRGAEGGAAPGGREAGRRAVPVELGARPVAMFPTESPWLRGGLQSLAAREPETAARLLAALLPVQALVAGDLAYDLTAPTVGTLRVVLAGGTAKVEPRERPGDRHEVDVLLEGPLDALAPLAAGGAGRKLKGVHVRGSRRRIRRLLKARRDPVGLADLGFAGSPVHPGLLLSALAAAVDPTWTIGHRLAVAYVIGGDGTFTVMAGDGSPLRVVPGIPEQAGGPTATVVVSARAFMPLIAGQKPPEDERATVTGERWAADLVHAWFDRARGVRAG